jgi:cell division protein FtsZ
VLDEKMKDEVKITVIATGFKTENLPKRERRESAAAAAIAQTRTAAAYTERPAPAGPPVSARPPAASPVRTVRDPEPVAGSPPVREETRSIEEVKSNVKATYESDDLDVPAFIRKRQENS